MVALARSWRWLCLSLLCLALAACAALDLRPSVSRNYVLVPVEPAEQSVEAMWRLKMQMALAARACDGRQLAESPEPCVEDWRTHVLRLRGMPPLVQLRQVHQIAFRAVDFSSDNQRWGEPDRWESPLQTLRHGGDCEDFALLEMESLRMLGWPEERLAMLVGTSRRTELPQWHAVLMVTLDDGAQVILDSAESDLVVPAGDYHFIPRYALTRTHVYKVMPWRERQRREQ